ncbi:MAG: BrnA antitoxin family protein [Armatimonadota bacterium]|nr:BrnA antitoxin family protein [Armatimonadota bacterium]
MDKKPVDPTPEHFDSYEEAAEFWDTHDTTDYLDEFRTVEVISELRARHFEVEIEEDVAKALQDKARQQGVSIGHLASDLLRQQLQEAA